MKMVMLSIIIEEEEYYKDVDYNYGNPPIEDYI
jgi:hypothetical protein